MAIKPTLAAAYDTEEILYRLYDSLPPEYNTTVAVLKSNEEKNAIKALRILQEMEDTLKKDTYVDTGIIARRPSRQQSTAQRRQEPRRPRRRKS